MPNSYSILDINPLEHITGDVAISQYNYNSIMNALTQWDQSKMDNITVRLATRTSPYFVDYVIHTKYYYDKNYGSIASETLLQPSSFSYTNRVKISAAKDDLMKVRVNVMNAGGTTWALYQDVAVYDEITATPSESLPGTYDMESGANYIHSYVDGLYFRDYVSDTHKIQLYRTTGDITGLDDDVTTPKGGNPPYNAKKVVIETNDKYVSGTYADDVMICCLNSAMPGVYVRNPLVESGRSANLNNSTSGYSKLCGIYSPSKSYPKGTLVYHDGEFYIAVVDNPVNPPSLHYTKKNQDDPDPDPTVPELNPDNWSFFTDSWESCLPIRLKNVNITGSGTIRATADTDINGIMLRNASSDIESDENTRISVVGSVSYPGSETKQPTGMDIFSTSNYANYPESRTAKWSAGTSYETAVQKSAYCKQDYSAVMVFNHFDVDVKYKNIVNYDGPDLDQGLCIMLPVKVTDDTNTTHDPRDGMIFEFLFNIWPNHEYDGREVNDLIINKSHIYVYSVPDYSEYLINGFSVNTVEPIAKFSMARLINFYVFSENVGVPDKPVCYKARFIYSQSEGRWKTYDYYQFPDHVFMSPSGFVDPSESKAYGVETAGFPLYQNPFSNYDLSAIHTSEEYRNQILKLDE